MSIKNKPPAFQFYIKDWLSSPRVRTMSAEQRGCYINLLAYSWPEGISYDTPDARSTLWALAGMPDADAWGKIAAPVLACFDEKDGRLVNAKLEEQFKGLDAYHRMQRDKAKKGADARWNKSGTNRAMPEDASSSSSATAFSTATTRVVETENSPANGDRSKATPTPIADPSQEDSAAAARSVVWDIEE